jgi:hypothetical protein
MAISGIIQGLKKMTAVTAKPEHEFFLQVKRIFPGYILKKKNVWPGGFIQRKPDPLHGFPRR